jgi:hypothetical protein
MTGMDQFLSQHYGTAAPVIEPTAEDVEKVAQAEFFLKLAAKHGVDVNSLDNEQLQSLWDKVFNKTAEEEPKPPEAAEEKPAEEKPEEKPAEKPEKPEKSEEEKAKKKAKKELKKAQKGQAKVAEAEQMGRIMAHKYVDELSKIAQANAQATQAPAAEAVTEKTAEAPAMESAIDSLAAKMAVEKAASGGWNAEEAAQRITAVLTLGPGESEKIAHASDVNGAVDIRSSELLEMAGYPIDWRGTPFDKTAEDKDAAAKDVAGKAGKWIAEKAHAAGKAVKEHSGYAAAKEAVHEHKALKEGLHPAHKSLVEGSLLRHKEEAAKKIGRLAGGAAAGGGAAVAGKALFGGKGKEASAQFDVAAAECAVQKAAAAGWDADEATSRLNALFTLGAEGDPEQSDKVAAAQSGEQALEFRACELLALAGYPINW